MMTFQSERLEDYLAASAVIDYHCGAIQTLAAEISAANPNETDRARAAFHYVRDRIPHTFDAGRQESTCAASEVLALGHGTCYAKSHLLAAILRAMGIPAGFGYQLLVLDDDEPETRLVLHGFNAVCLSEAQRWIRLDARGNKPGVEAHFDLAQETLAFPVREQLGERMFQTIHAQPLAAVVDTLTGSRDAEELRLNLPGAQAGLL